MFDPLLVLLLFGGTSQCGVHSKSNVSSGDNKRIDASIDPWKGPPPNLTVERTLPRNMGAEINVTVGSAIDDSVIDQYRKEWLELCQKYYDPSNPTDLSWELKYGEEAQNLRSRLAAELRSHVAKIRHEERKLPLEDERFKSPEWWTRYTKTEGASDPDVKFIGQNWAIRRLQKFLKDYDDAETPGKDN